MDEFDYFEERDETKEERYARIARFYHWMAMFLLVLSLALMAGWVFSLKVMVDERDHYKSAFEHCHK